MPDRLVLFVCTANQCRSPMAEYLLRDRFGRGTSWKVMSAGLAASDGIPASEQAIEAVKERGIDMSAHRSRALTRKLADDATLIVAMTLVQKDLIQRRFPDTADKLFILKSIGAESQGGDIVDPVGMSVHTYREIRDEIAGELPGLILFLDEYGKDLAEAGH